MTVTVVVPDVMGDLRTWLRALPDLGDITGARVFFKTPLNAAYPLIRLTEASLAPQTGTAPLWLQRTTIEVIGAAPVDGRIPDYYKVDQAKRIICSAIWALTGPIGTTTLVKDGSIDSANDYPDPDDGGARKVITAALLVTAQ